MATCYGLDGPGIEFPLGESDNHTIPDRPYGPSRLL